MKKTRTQETAPASRKVDTVVSEAPTEAAVPQKHRPVATVVCVRVPDGPVVCGVLVETPESTEAAVAGVSTTTAPKADAEK